jgi:hypothetical protein
MKIYQDLFALFLTLLLPSLVVCTSKSRDESPDAKDFTVILGSGGGFTGMANGYIIHSDGKIEKWSGLYFRRDKVEPFGTASKEALKPLSQVFGERAFAQWSYKETGNMTTQVWCISGQDHARRDTAIVSWNGIEPGKEVPQPIRDLYENLMQAVNSVRKP